MTDTGSMLVLLLVGLVGGIITSISPCVLPVLPVILASSSRADPADPARTGRGGRGSRGGRWRPYGVVAGLVVSFSLSTLFGSLVLSALHLPQDLLRDVGILVLAVLGVSLLVPAVRDALERPFARLAPGRSVSPDRNGLVVGMGLGLLFVPCAGPVLATIAVVGATHHVGFGAVVLTAAFGVGVGLPLLALALAGDALVRRTGVLRTRARAIRLTSGVVMIALALAIATNVTDGLQRHVPGYTTALQKAVERSGSASSQLQRVAAATTDGPGAATACTEGGPTLEDCGKAPAFTGIDGWFDTPGDRPLTLAGLRGKVVLVDFWTYSCINCQRALPHVEAWDRSYAADGLVVVGVHTPEFAFEHVASNVRSQAAALGVRYPVALDDGYGTWDAYANKYWPAEYLIDATGTVRHVSFGEGGYGTTETLIRQLLTATHPATTLPAPTDVAITTPVGAQTPETYLGYRYPPAFSGQQPVPDVAHRYALPAMLTPDTVALGGTWTQSSEAVTAGAGATLELSYQARTVYLVLAGSGTVTVTVGGRTTVIAVRGVPTLYPLAHSAAAQRALLSLTASPGVQAYDLTFG